MSNINDFLSRFNAMHSLLPRLFTVIIKLAEENKILKPLNDQAYLMIREGSTSLGSHFVPKKTSQIDPKLEIQCLDLMTELVKNEQWGEAPNILYSKQDAGKLGGAMNIRNDFFGEYELRICLCAHDSVTLNEAMAIVIVLFDQGFQKKSISDRTRLFVLIEEKYPNEYLKRIMDLLGWFEKRQ